VFRHLDPHPDALDTLMALRHHGHDIVIITAKPDWAVPDTLRWLADHGIPALEVHFQEEKHTVECDVYLDDSPLVLPNLVQHRSDATVMRFVRPWNRPVAGAIDVATWADVHATVTDLH
jgi:5'(3')-deoxyribonucleotidase